MTNTDNDIVSANVFTSSSVTQFIGDASEAWILTTGIWNDLEFWDDNSFWTD